MNISIPVGLGELYDKISILEIKSSRIAHEGKLAFVHKELEQLRKIAEMNPTDPKLYAQLKEANESLWEIEDAIRVQESKKDFGDAFIRLARSVYVTNDRRAEIKKAINLTSGSEIVEVKSYAPYGEEGDARVR